ncbi:MAG: division/cell wall cluster transcriptional repressor MraZ [Clostridia bacterium]|nr:division/cell wall cluster transcriptional repressor MraZ [Clostridia bacterium]
MLIGRAVHNLDTKGRIVIPARYRDDFGASIFALYGVKGCIRLYNREEFEKLTEKVMSGDINRDAFRRKVFGSVELVSFDAQGRILLTEDLRKKAGITDKVCMVGMYNWLELWNEDRLAEIEKELTTEEELKCMEALGLA